MSNSTPQGPGPEFGSNPDASPVDETQALDQAMAEETAAAEQQGDDELIDISRNEGPELTADTDDWAPTAGSGAARSDASAVRGDDAGSA